MNRAIALLLLLAVFTQPAVGEDKLLGVELKLDDGALVVIKVLPDGPAARAGLRTGERIVAIDAQSTADLSADDVGRLLTDRGVPVTLTVASNGRAPRQLRISREPIDRRKRKDAEAEDAAVLAAAAAHNRVLARRGVRGAVLFRVEPSAETLRDALAREVEFMAKVGELTAAERQSLVEQGELAIKRRESLLTRQRNVPAGFVGGLELNGGNQIRQVQLETPDQAVRRELTPVLKAISHDAWEKFDAVRERLDERRQRADALAQVAALDEALLLTRQQRETLSELLCESWAQMWRRRDNEGASADPVQLCLNVSHALDLFDIPEAWRQEIMRPSQEAVYKAIQSPVTLETVFVEAAPAANPAGQNNVAPVQVRLMGFGQAGQAVARKVLRHGLPPGEERERLQSLLERLVEDADVHVVLDDVQKQKEKLLLAGKLDIERHFQQDAGLEREKNAPGKVVATVQTQIAGAKVRLAPIFTDAASVFQKTLHSRLSAGQWEKLSESRRERGRFRRQAVLAALTMALCNRAALTDAQADRVEEWLTGNLAAPADADDLAAWRRSTLEQLAILRPEALKPLVDDWQWPAAREYVKELAVAAQAQQGQPADQPPAVLPDEMLLGIPAQP